MLTDEERSALTQWYSQTEVLDRAKQLYEDKHDEELEEHLHMMCLVPLSRHGELPDYMRAADGQTLFPSNLNPRADLEKWQDAIEIGWEVVEKQLGFSHDDIHKRIAATQKADWDEFLASAEARRKSQG